MLGIEPAEVCQQVADLLVLMADLRGVGKGLALAAATVRGEGAGGLDGIVMGLKCLELGGLAEGAAAEAADTSEEALSGECAVAEHDEGGACDLANALSLESERLACELDGLAAFRKVALPGRSRRWRRLGRCRSRRWHFGRGGGYGQKAASVMDGDAAAEEAAGERGDGVGSHSTVVGVWMGCGRRR